MSYCTVRINCKTIYALVRRRTDLDRQYEYSYDEYSQVRGTVPYNSGTSSYDPAWYEYQEVRQQRRYTVHCKTYSIESIE